ncbi:MAG: SusC/RagA family protein, partial [Candidatus Symbiothrix sp.]|nr:SusC/RagA family protein [Candidatus Symbiothrix sp.]
LTYRVIGDGQKNFLPGSTIGAEGNIFKNAADAWSIVNPSQDVFYPRMHLGYNANNAQTSDWWLKDMSMCRLKNLELGYSLPQSLITKVAMGYARVFVRGTNLFQFSSFRLWDPELDTNNGLQYPIMATYSMGLQIRF